MATFIHLYQGNPTSGAIDGTLVSENTGLAPISVTLNATNNEISSNIKLAVRCDTGYLTAGSTTITPTGATAAKWALSSDGSSWNAYGAALTIPSVITATNTIFYARSKATADEVPSNDVSVDLVIQATVGAV